MDKKTIEILGLNKMEKIKILGWIECDEKEFENTLKKNKLSVCFGEDYNFKHFRRSKRYSPKACLTEKN